MRKKAAYQAEVPDALIDALEAILAYIWEDECYDYHHCCLAGPERERHIFLKLEVMRHWLDAVEDEISRR